MGVQVGKGGGTGVQMGSGVLVAIGAGNVTTGRFSRLKLIETVSAVLATHPHCSPTQQISSQRPSSVRPSARKAVPAGTVAMMSKVRPGPERTLSRSATTVTAGTSGVPGSGDAVGVTVAGNAVVEGTAVIEAVAVSVAPGAAVAMGVGVGGWPNASESRL